MKKFIVKTLSFLFIPIISTLIIIGLLFNSYFSKPSFYKINSNISELYVGDSHVQLAIIDSLLDNTLSIATSSESLYFSYFRLEKIFENENNIKTLYLGFSYHSLSDYYDNFIFGKYSYSISPKYFYYLPFKERVQLIKYNKHKLPSFLRSIFKTSYNYLKPNNKFGGFNNRFFNTKAMQKSMKKRIDFQYHSKGKLNDFSIINQLYLKKIINLCKKQKVELVIVNTPLHSYYVERVPNEYKARYNKIIENYNLKLYDFKNLNLSDSCFIPDGDHLSVKGADKLTKELIKRRTNNNAYKLLGD